MRNTVMEPERQGSPPDTDPPGRVGTIEAIPVGTQVELRSRFDERWTRGFSIALREQGEYRVRRLSDGAVLPAWFPAHMLRPLLRG